MKNVYEIFKKLNGIPRASHHEERVADFLCNYAEGLGLEFERDNENCVVIRKPATPGHENAETVVLLNHMDMVAVGDGSKAFNPLADGIEAYVENGWMKARGTSLGADNGIGLSMALAVLADDNIVHGPIEVLTTTNEEDGMTGAANLAGNFIKGRKVINLDSEDYDTITVGAAGAYIQEAKFATRKTTEVPDASYFRLTVEGGLGGHSGVDINKGRINANKAVCLFLADYHNSHDGENGKGNVLFLSEINGGVANASIPDGCTAIVGVPHRDKDFFMSKWEEFGRRLKAKYEATEPHIRTVMEPTGKPAYIIMNENVADAVASLPCGVIRMHDEMPGTVMTSNNIGMIRTCSDCISVSCHTRSFSDAEMVETADGISRTFKAAGAEVSILMNTPGWQENTDSGYLTLVESTFDDVLGFKPRKVAMHFVLEAGYYVQKFPGIEIACIGPRIVEPHSTKERVELQTVDNIWLVLVELLKRLA